MTEKAKNAHIWARQINRKWRSEIQRAAISTHNKSEQFGVSLAQIGLGEDLERFMNKKNNEQNIITRPDYRLAGDNQ